MLSFSILWKWYDYVINLNSWCYYIIRKCEMQEGKFSRTFLQNSHISNRKSISEKGVYFFCSLESPMYFSNIFSKVQIVLRLLVSFHACCGCLPWKNSPLCGNSRSPSSWPLCSCGYLLCRRIQKKPGSIISVHCDCFLKDSSLFCFELGLAIHVYWILLSVEGCPCSLSYFLSLEEGDRPLPPVGFLVALRYS